MTGHPLVQTLSELPTLPLQASLDAAALTAILAPRPNPVVVLFGALSVSSKIGIISISPVSSNSPVAAFMITRLCSNIQRIAMENLDFRCCKQSIKG